MKPDIELIHADARKLSIPDNSVQCIVTSPPYWGLRKYSGDQGVEPYGLEPTIELYITHTVEILRELWRVLRSDGVLFWNIGDSYAASHAGAQGQSGLRADRRFTADRCAPIGGGLKPKDLCLIPSRVAIAAQADGWWVRSMILWAKPNPMPESVTDRPTDAYEHIIMLTKSERYFWDADAVREPTTGNAHHPGYGDGGPKARAREKEGTFQSWRESTSERFTSRNLRNIWMFATQPYAEAHFATFPEELPRRCILAATSARGACLQCAAPWLRVTGRNVSFESGSGKAGNPPDGKNGANYNQAQSGNYDIRMGPVVESQTIGWRPTCLCPGQHGKTAPCVVLDPFAGSGTTGRVARSLRRRAILCDIAYGEKDEYRNLALDRIKNVQVEFF